MLFLLIASNLRTLINHNGLLIHASFLFVCFLKGITAKLKLEVTGPAVELITLY